MMTTNNPLKNRIVKPPPPIIYENRAEIFFDNAIFLGQWNPSLNINQLPNNKTENGIFIITTNGKFKNMTLNKGQLIKYINDNSPIMLYQNFLPFVFLESFIKHFQQECSIGDIDSINLVDIYQNT